MRRLLLLGFVISAPCYAVPVIPNFTLDQRPNWTQQNPGDAFQFTEVYQAPGMESVTDITRTIQSTSVTDTTTIFSQ